jgi:hypothetical protein
VVVVFSIFVCYVSVPLDLSSSALEEAKEDWERNEKPFVARFCELNPCMVRIE